jgi:hypothetical protein
MLGLKQGFSFKIILLTVCFLTAFGSVSHAADFVNANPVCDNSIGQGVSAQVNKYAVGIPTDYYRTNYTPPMSLGQVANTPCMSKELQRITNQFAYAPSMYGQQLTGGLLSAGGPVSGIMQKLFKSSFQSINSASSIIPGMSSFQSMASSVMGDLMSSLGLGDAFSSEVCGLMVDMVLKYVQCENPIQLPSLGNIFGSLNNLLPNGCAGSALRSTLYQAADTQSLNVFSQSIPTASGTFSSGGGGMSLPQGY